MPAGLDGHPDPLTSPARQAVLADLAATLITVAPGRVALVAIDGIDGGGKSTFADELAPVLRGLGRPVVRSTTDSFHKPRRVRWREGKLSPIGFYRDSHDLATLKHLLLDPLISDPPKPFWAAAFDEPTDRPVDAPIQAPEPDLILVFDGLFLQRPELRRYWDFVVYLDGERRVTSQRIERATAACPPGADGFLHLAAYWAVLGRYVHGFDLYRRACDPRANADAVVDNNDFLSPSLSMQLRRERARLPDVIPAGSVELRRLRPRDADALVRAISVSLDELRTWFDWAATAPSVEAQRARLEAADVAFDAGDDFELGIFAPDDGLVGCARLNPASGRRRAEIGYWVRSDRTSRGHASAATRALVRAAFEHLDDIDEVEIHTDQANLASIAVARSAGFTLDREVNRELTAPGHTGRGFVWRVRRPT